MILVLIAFDNVPQLVVVLYHIIFYIEHSLDKLVIQFLMILRPFHIDALSYLPVFAVQLL